MLEICCIYLTIILIPKNIAIKLIFFNFLNLEQKDRALVNNVATSVNQRDKGISFCFQTYDDLSQIAS